MVLYKEYKGKYVYWGSGKGKGKPTMYVPHGHLSYGRGTGVTLKEAKRAFLSGMTKKFKRQVKVKFTR